LPSGALAWWRAESSALDHVGPNHGVMNNGAAFAPGKVGTAFLLDGVNDFVSIADSPTFSNLPQISFAVWFKFNALPPSKFQMILTKGRVAGRFSNSFWLFREDAPGRIIAGVETAADVSGVSTPQAFNDTNQFHLAVVTYDGAQVTLYLDGAAVSTNLTTGAVRTDSDPILIGRRNDPGVDGVGDVMNGLVDEVMIFNRVLGSNEIAGIFAAGGRGVCAPECPAFTRLAGVSTGRPVRVLTVDTNKAGLCNGQPIDFASPRYQTLRGDLIDPARFGPGGTVTRSIELLPPVPAISLAALTNAEVAILFAGSYSSSERDLLRAFVACGGGILAYGNNAAIALADIVGASPGGFTGTAQATVTTAGSPVTSGPFGSIAVSAVLPTGFAGSFINGGLGANGAAFMANDAGVFGATFNVGAGRVAAFCDEELFIDPPSVNPCYNAHLGAASRTLFLNAIAHVILSHRRRHLLVRRRKHHRSRPASWDVSGVPSRKAHPLNRARWCSAGRLHPGGVSRSSEVKISRSGIRLN
jgi:hypothetical protein